MGYLHRGHVELMKRAARLGGFVVTSIFVNPMQFGPAEDLVRYPRDFAGDRAKCAAAGVRAIFAPSAKDMYPGAFQTVVRVSEIEKGLCGDRRPGHFAGVATVVAKLFNIVRPHVAVFGEKDYQQLCVIRRMAADLDMGVKIIGVPTIREPDGLAMSSRNVYLSADERVRALALPRALQAAEKLYDEGERDPKMLVTEASGVLANTRDVEVEYVEVRSADLAVVDRLTGPSVILAAVRVGTTRLIDNRILGRRQP
jgi:pantoate--beta-alanine ligase